MKKNNKKGFTLAELLIVVAIIAVLAGISIPIFSSTQKKAYVATNQANARAAYALVTSTYLTENLAAGTYQYNTTTNSGTLTSGTVAGATFNTSSTAIADWTVGNPSGIDAKTYTVWGVTIDGNGQVTGYSAK